jgi:hypothetical protein
LLCHDDDDSQMSSELARQTLILQELLRLRQTMKRHRKAGHTSALYFPERSRFS